MCQSTDTVMSQGVPSFEGAGRNQHPLMASIIDQNPRLSSEKSRFLENIQNSCAINPLT
jgi:hypothetical protein